MGKPTLHKTARKPELTSTSLLTKTVLYFEYNKTIREERKAINGKTAA